MAKKSDVAIKQLTKKKVTRTGVHSKCKTSKLKSSKNYRKTSRGQG